MKKTNGSSNGKTGANGHQNGHTEANGASKAAPSLGGKTLQDQNEIKAVGWFYPILSGLGMIVLPLCIYWCWICVTFNKGAMLLPQSYDVAGISSWWQNDIWQRIVQHAAPTQKAWTIYLTWVGFQALLFAFAPGPEGEGLVVPDGYNKGKRLIYKYNGQFAWFTTIAVAVGLHYTGLFRMSELYDNFGPLQTVCELYTAGIIAILYVYAWMTGNLERRTDSHVYDYFMGPMINPRMKVLGVDFDIKFFHELRPGIMHWYFTTIGLAMKQYETYGQVSTPMLLVCFYHLCFVNACYKGEPCVPMTMDIYYEKFGWMLCWLDLVTVPFVFPLQAAYLYEIGPFEHPWYITAGLLFMHCFGYWMFDTANSQKDYFRLKPGEHKHAGFPQLPWGKLDKPKFLNTKRGTKLLIDGWWAYSRHMNYFGDILMSWCWGLTCGVTSYFPFAYTTYLTPLLIHRERRDNTDCKHKYGEDWDEYCRIVPARIIPYIY